ncbi:MAG: hypothetical protein COV59_04485 [Candidatus Magasanikbacteria bacterium CG11_big_fil_rev_8_21_14_0_20_39_34]|uniref:Uncharacterized protein n=1 Tax=Candidatus Magasanikbacteria bacterium CG11_big_fil_rev_8_21_14_0_20_39_34 TaxID=1974653 RepID=A0A2H0N481_9BACT|nr:MAG: hypothetical protein COV59_04485 [Candidatus Magasanikbacteria bacterium CG11_big_fil_rev_8_21_14_0_20_39_34]
MIEQKISELEKNIIELQERNKRVEADKAWEVSTFRKGSIIGITYGVAVVVMFSLHINKPHINAIIPTVGFFLSTLTLPFLKKWWIKNHQ